MGGVSCEEGVFEGENWLIILRYVLCQLLQHRSISDSLVTVSQSTLYNISQVLSKSPRE